MHGKWLRQCPRWSTHGTTQGLHGTKQPQFLIPDANEQHCQDAQLGGDASSRAGTRTHRDSKGPAPHSQGKHSFCGKPDSSTVAWRDVSLSVFATRRGYSKRRIGPRSECSGKCSDDLSRWVETV